MSKSSLREVLFAHQNYFLLSLHDERRFGRIGSALEEYGIFKHRIAEIHATSIKRLSKVEAADDPSDGADDE